jgi:hypothetical protein
VVGGGAGGAIGGLFGPKKRPGFYNVTVGANEDGTLGLSNAFAAKLEAAGGRPSALIRGVIDSAPFQQRRAPVRAVNVSLNAPAP